MALITIVNDYNNAVTVKLGNVVTTQVAAGGTAGPYVVDPSENNYNFGIMIARTDDPTCGVGDAGGLVSPGKQFQLHVYTSPSGLLCGNPPKVELAAVINPGNKEI